MDLRQGILTTAQRLGMNPVDLATIISYETGGTFDPSQPGPTTKWGQHRGLIQFGEPQARQYGVDWNNPLASQLGPDGAIVRYFEGSGWRPGMGLLDAYSIVNAGGPGRYNASDTAAGGAPGTVRDKVQEQMGAHRQKAVALLGGDIAADTMRALGKDNMQVSTKGQPMGLLGEIPQDEPGGLLSLFGANRPKWTDKANDIGAVLLALSGTPGAGAVMQGLQERKKDKRETQRMNQTIAWLRSQGRDDLASAVMSGGLSGAQAAQIAVTPADPLKDLQVQKAQLELAQLQAGKDPNVQSSQLLPDQSGVVLVMRDGSVKVRTAGDQELGGQEALDFVQQSQQRSADYQRSIYGARREGTLGADIQLAQEAEAAGARGAAIGKAEGEAQVAAPGKIAMVNQIEGQVNDLLNDPYLPNMLGPVASRLPNLSGDAARVQSKMDQLSGGAFLQARQLLKGGGAITDFESKKAEQAFIRMNAAQEIGDFRAAMNDFLDAIKTGLPKLESGTNQPSASAADMSDDDLLRMYGN